MFKIPDTYYQNNEDYITLPAIRKFVDSHPDGKFKRTGNRKELLDDILAYAEQSDDHTEAVLSWIDEVLQEGIKDIYLQYTPLPEEMNLLFTTQTNIEKHLRIYTNPALSRHICMNQYGKDYVLVSAVYSTDEYGRRITFTYCKKLHIYDRVKHSSRPIDYPVTADYFLDQNWLLVRAKPRSNLYLYEPDGFILEAAETTTTEKEIRLVMRSVENILGTKMPGITGKGATAALLKNKIFKLLDKYSQTPAEIAAVISAHDEQIQRIFNTIQGICAIPDLCMLPKQMQEDVVGDISNIVEKYLSINWRNKRIFIQDREAYPIRISATDEEESKVEQTAASTEPLQTKALFFDNKKMLYKSKSCDGVTFRWTRKKPIALQNPYFCVRIFESLSPNCKLSASKVALANGIDFELAQKILQKLVEEKILKYAFGLRCPVCGLLLGMEDDLPSIEKEQFCYQCGEIVEIMPDDVEVIYTFDDYPFVTGQQNEEYLELDESVALPLDSLAQLIASGALDLNVAFFSPTEQEYQTLQSAYDNIFTEKVTTKETGDSLEALTVQLFNLCRHFRAAPIRIQPNQIDCYVHNTLYIPGLSQAPCKDSFVIECKNEAKTPTAGYMNKLHSILRNTGKQFGIIVSKCSAPSTFVTLSNTIFLNDKIIIISIDVNDLKSIIFQKTNLLECMSRKIDAVKLNATKGLVALGLYSV